MYWAVCWLLMLTDLSVHPKSFLSITRGAPWSAVRPCHRHVESRVHTGRNAYWWTTLCWLQRGMLLWSNKYCMSSAVWKFTLLNLRQFIVSAVTFCWLCLNCAEVMACILCWLGDFFQHHRQVLIPVVNILWTFLLWEQLWRQDDYYGAAWWQNIVCLLSVYDECRTVPSGCLLSDQASFLTCESICRLLPGRRS